MSFLQGTFLCCVKMYQWQKEYIHYISHLHVFKLKEDRGKGNCVKPSSPYLDHTQCKLVAAHWTQKHLSHSAVLCVNRFSREKNLPTSQIRLVSFPLYETQ